MNNKQFDKLRQTHFNPETNPDYKRWLDQSPEFFEGLGERNGAQLKTAIRGPFSQDQINQTIKTTLSKMPLTGERAAAFTRGFKKGFGEPRK